MKGREGTGSLSIRELILGLMVWAPLIALVLSSLGLIVLKRISGLPPWVRRLTIPPFYFVSLSIVTLTIGMEVLVVDVFAWLSLFDVYHDWQWTIFMGALFTFLVPAFGVMRAWEASPDVPAGLWCSFSSLHFGPRNLSAVVCYGRRFVGTTNANIHHRTRQPCFFCSFLQRPC
jgi:hypothetical protein